MILHGIYDNGKIDLVEKKYPKIKTEVEIIVKEPVNKQKIVKIRPKGKDVSGAVIEERYD